MAEEKQLTDEQLEEIQDLQEDMVEDAQEDQLFNTQEFQENYGSPDPDEKQNQHSFLHKAAFDSTNTIKTTFLSTEELGRPLFNVRFLMDLEDISKFYLDDYAKKYGVNEMNRVSNYFLQKIYNITDSGMSKDGFSMNLNVTRKMDCIRKKVRGNIENIKGGINRK